MHQPANLPRLKRCATIIGGSLFQRIQPCAHFRDAAHHYNRNTRTACLHAGQLHSRSENEFKIALLEHLGVVRRGLDEFASLPPRPIYGRAPDAKPSA